MYDVDREMGFHRQRWRRRQRYMIKSRTLRLFFPTSSPPRITSAPRGDRNICSSCLLITSIKKKQPSTKKKGFIASANGWPCAYTRAVQTYMYVYIRSMYDIVYCIIFYGRSTGTSSKGIFS